MSEELTTSTTVTEEKKGFKWGRFFSMTLFIIVILTTLLAGVLYLIYSKDKANWILTIVLFSLPSIMTSGFIYIVSSASVQEKIAGYLKLVGDAGNSLSALTVNKNGTITATSTITQQTSAPAGVPTNPGR